LKRIQVFDAAEGRILMAGGWERAGLEEREEEEGYGERGFLGGVDGQRLGALRELVRTSSQKAQRSDGATKGVGRRGATGAVLRRR
jgi:hypothetical protein